MAFDLSIVFTYDQLNMLKHNPDQMIYQEVFLLPGPARPCLCLPG